MVARGASLGAPLVYHARGGEPHGAHHARGGLVVLLLAACGTQSTSA